MNEREQSIVRRWREGVPADQIASSVGVNRHTLYTTIYRLRRRYGEQVVPRRHLPNGWNGQRKRERDERLIALYKAGESYAEIAQHPELGAPGSVKGRIKRLLDEGKIERRNFHYDYERVVELWEDGLNGDEIAYVLGVPGDNAAQKIYSILYRLREKGWPVPKRS